MSNKKVLLTALAVVAAIALTVPFTGRTANIRSSVAPNPLALENSPLEKAPTVSTEQDVPQVVSLQVTPSGSGAAKLAEQYARELGLSIVGVEEITRTGRSSSSEPKVLSTSGKSYFAIGH
jgi:hypothetical protein